MSGNDSKLESDCGLDGAISLPVRYRAEVAGIGHGRERHALKSTKPAAFGGLRVRGRRLQAHLIAMRGEETLGEVETFLQGRDACFEVLALIEMLSQVGEELELLAECPALATQENDPDQYAAGDEAVEQGPDDDIAHSQPPL
jgi:hypothetical protein